MKKFILPYILLLAFASCSYNETDIAVSSSRQISFTSLNDKVSRTANENSSNYKVLAAMSSASSEWYINEEIKSADNSIISGKNYYWLSPAQDIDFYGYAPADATVVERTYPNYTLEFTVPSTADKDFTIASKQTQGSGTVNLAFGHALSKIDISLSLESDLATAGYILESGYTAEITAAKSKGTISPVAATPQWTLDNTTSSAIYTGKLSYMIMPQPATGVTVSIKNVVITKGGTEVYSGNLTAHTFVSGDIPASGSGSAANTFGMNTCYNVGFEIKGTSTGVFGDAVNFSVTAADWSSGDVSLPPAVITPAIMTLPSMAVTSQSNNLTVTCGDSDEWTLISSDPWATLSLNSDGSGASNTVTGTGSKTVYLLAEANSSTSARSATISYRGRVVTNITQFGSSLNPGLTAGIPIPSTKYSYVGAFWKHNQTGERLIRIPVADGSGGDWTAFIYSTDGNWSADDIVLSKEALPIYPASSDAAATLVLEDTPAVSGSSTTVSGTAVYNATESSAAPIYFRIGLKSAFTPTYAVPARYAIVAITYAGNSKIQLLYLRQGEDPDYLMRPTDRYGNSPDVTAVGDNLRPAAKKFSAYNVTAVTLNAQCDRARTATNPSKFTAFPSQAGAFFHWANATYPRYAYSPVGSVILDTSYPSDYWSTLFTTHESSPENYLLSSGSTKSFRRPNDGSTSGDNSAGNVEGSEFRQSLWYSPKAGYLYNSVNFLFGYYADGYFDRLDISTSTGTHSGTANSCVNAGDAAVAYVGNIFFNPLSGASLFLPAAGFRSSDRLSEGGLYGYFWSSSVVDATYGWYLYFCSDFACQYDGYLNVGYCVRPVLDE